MNARELRIVFMGTPDFAVAPLRALVEGGYNVVAVVTTPDKPAGRGLKTNESAVKKYASEAGLKILQPEKLKDEKFLDELRAMDADLGMVIAFRMLPEVVWSQPRLGTFNLHASLLPQYRGAAPINWAIIDGETETGVTTFFLNDEIDKGAIIAQRKVAITPCDNAATLHDKLMDAGTGLVVETVEMIANGETSPLPQPPSPEGLKQAPKIFKEDCLINWSDTATNICNFIRGLSPYPIAWTYLRKECAACNPDADAGEKDAVPVKIFSARCEKAEHDKKYGEIITDGKTYLKAVCRDGFVTIDELQAAGKKRMTTEEFLRGFKEIAACRF